MFNRSAWVHLRIPFSFFLMPVFLFAWATVEQVELLRFLLVFLSLHLFLYPASNGFNSFFDKDEGPIGGLENPPEVSRSLYRLSLTFDGLALLLGLMVSYTFAILLLIYGLVSKAYSHPIIRLKKYPITSWLTIGVFQGGFTFITVIHGLTLLPLEDVLSYSYLLPAGLSSLLLLGSYPMTQVYQHEEDERRGDRTISLLLGIRGTFLFTLIVFTIASGLYFVYFQNVYSTQIAILFLLAMFPVVGYFGWWLLKVFRNEGFANFKSTMRLNLISSVCFIVFFCYLGLTST